MAAFTYLVEVECETAEQAAQVMAERIYFDEEYGFDYEINVLWDRDCECAE